MKILNLILLSLLISFLLYLGIATAIFQARNPTANRMQAIIHLKEVITFKKLDKFQ